MRERINCTDPKLIPPHMMDEIQRYINMGVQPCSFLTAVICNDLNGACGKADDYNIAIIPAYVNYFYNHVPIRCWGSRDLMERWLGGFGTPKP